MCFVKTKSTTTTPASQSGGNNNAASTEWPENKYTEGLPKPSGEILKVTVADKYGYTTVDISDDSVRVAKVNFTETQIANIAKALSGRVNPKYSVTYEDAVSELTSYNGTTDWWWLRTSGRELTRAAAVSYSGELYKVGNEVEEPFGGLRPAIWVNIAAPSVGNTSDWAKPEIEKADQLGLIPDTLKGQDLTKPITRAEFAAVSVKVYEALSGVAAIPAVNNPFTDTKDVEVLKAYNVGLTAGTAADKFSPDVLLNREQAATMLTRVFKKVSLSGWTLADDAKFTLPYTKPAAFADDKDISDWAKDSVYFMAANGIISGTGNNNFSPKAVTPEQQAKGYAQATREQALAIAVRMVENQDKLKQSVATGAVAPTPSAPAASGETAKRILAGETRNIKFGGYEWRVLEVSGDKALLITEDIIKQGQQYQDALKISAKDETTHYLWAYSLVRAYCNGEFLNTFTAEEQALIIPTALVMEPNPASGQESGPSTTDKIWCLSVSEVQKYFTYETAYARNHTNNKTEFWWLRTTGSSFMTACVAPHVLSTASETGKYVGTNSIDTIGVRPAMWISLK